MDSDLLSKIKSAGEIPSHVAIIMDGNGRWARKRFMPRPFGHRAGMNAVRESVKGCLEAGVRYLTVYAFSTENWNRPEEEVHALMNLLAEFIERETDDLANNSVKVNALGDLDRLGPGSREAIDRLLLHTCNGTQLDLNLCISYSAREEIARAARQLADAVLAGELRADEIDESQIASRLYTAEMPDPDLLIRTSGELRISNFLLWQLAYTELHVTPVLWPDFTRNELFAAIDDYQNRERRFGGVTT